MVDSSLRIHSTILGSRVNGPGNRAVLWLQGCSLGCRECFNPETHSSKAGSTLTVEKAFELLTEHSLKLDGTTISGGEPFEQGPQVLELCARIKTRTNLSVICFSGFTLKELERKTWWDPSRLDVLIAGRYDAQRRVARGLVGSSNKQFHFFTQRYSLPDFINVPEGEIFIHENGSMQLSGIEPLRF